MPLPPEVQPTGTSPLDVESVWQRGPGDVWAVIYGRERYLLHTRPTPHPVRFPDSPEGLKLIQERRPPGPLGWGCQYPFVLLYTLSRKAPLNYDYPATRAALKGHTELQDKAEFVEFERMDRRYFGARVDQPETAEKLAALVKAKVAGATPQVACHDPAVSRTLDIDLATGNLRK